MQFECRAFPARLINGVRATSDPVGAQSLAMRDSPRTVGGQNGV